jgi:hypothetical protein
MSRMEGNELVAAIRWKEQAGETNRLVCAKKANWA